MSRMRRLRHVLLPLPVFGAQLSAYWVHWATPISANMAYSLIEGLRAPVVVHDDTARRLFPEIKPMDYTTVLKNSLARVDAGQVDTSWSDALATSQGDVAPVTFAWREGMFIERRQRITAAPPEQLYRVFTGLGGEHGWLEFEAQPQPDGTTRLLQTAFYVPRGFLGHVYWYSLVPFHAFIFSGLIDQIVRHAEANAGIMRERKLATA